MCYYEAYQLTTLTTGSYMFLSRSASDPYIYLYNGSFSSRSPDLNLLELDDRDIDGGSFRFTMTLQSNLEYILVITTFAEYSTGEYTLIVSGLNKVNIVSTDNASVVSVSNVTTNGTWARLRQLHPILYS